MKAKYRGGSTNQTGRNKRNFHIKLLNDKGNDTNKKLLGMRNDNSWLLDAGQVDLGRIRNHVAHEIWRDMGNDVYYSADEPDAKNYINAEFAELFINDNYFGLYSLTEAVDRKQLQLELANFAMGEVRGVLYKATSYIYTGMYGPFDAADDTSGAWGGFELKYPEISDLCPTDWEPFETAVRFVDESGKDEFGRDAGEYFDLPVFLDCFIFHTVLAATDHAGKNLYYACYDIREGRPMFTLIPWDYDTTLGQTWDNGNVHSVDYGPEMGDYMYFAYGEGTKLLYRLATEDVDDFVDKSIERYWELRRTVFDEDSLTARYNDYFDFLRRSGTLARETRRWSGDTDISGLELDFDSEQAYIDDYIRRRLVHLDGIFTRESAMEAIAASIETPAATGNHEGAATRYNLNGQRVDENYKGIVITGGKKILVR
ncbi:MAG: CotH kinase family protein, partial [Prevotella sp.]|nr:CotH kinase family protein [Prevotella sp.]